MLKLAILIAALLVAVRPSAAQTPQSKPPLPVQRRGLPCGDYCGKQWSTCRSVPVFATPGRSAALQNWLEPLRIVTVIEGLNVVEQPGVVVLREPLVVYPDTVNTMPNSRTETVHFSGRDTVYVLDRESDGDSWELWHIWYRGKPRSTRRFWDDSPGAKAVMVRQPAGSWWIKIRMHDERLGWVMYDQDAFAGTAPHYTGGPERCTPIK